MERLDPLYTPLRGLNLIEASAGSGKTYALTALYLRLVMEAAIPVHRILVVTYTNAATRELRDRIRQRLGQIRLAFLRGRAEDEDEFSARMLDVLPDRELALRRLNNAARGFDEAAIFTIHGFCQRALADSAFASGLAFETELLADTSDLLQEIVEDFWRREFYPASPLVVQYFLDKSYSPARLLATILPYLGKPYLEISTPESSAAGPSLEQAFVAAWRRAQQLWQADGAAIEQLLLTAPGLNRKKYSLKALPGWLSAMAAYFSAENPQLALFPKFEQFTTATLEKSRNADQPAPQHAFFDACAHLKAACDRLVAACQRQIPVKLLRYCEAELATRKRRRQVQSYDDLLLDLCSALRHPQRGGPLTDTLRHRYAAALVDEFQDTDPVQYEIFRRIYADAQQPVFLVGDPKQAIYSFRGADLFAYLAARHDAQQRYTLDVNWRSDPRLLTALNAVFGAGQSQPFLFDAIGFQPALPAAKKRHEPLWIQGRNEPPFQIWWLEPDGGQPLNKGIANERAARATAAEIAHLLTLGALGQAGIGERPLSGGDIAVLVRNHRQGQLIRDQLLRLGVPSVQHVDASVFAAREAQQLADVLAAVLEPGDEGRVRAALAGDLFGLSGETLYQLRDAEQAWARWLEVFQNYRQQWREQGFMRFFRTWLKDYTVAPRLLAFQDGERRLTNMLHLAELLHIASRSHAGMAGLLKWFGDRRRAPTRSDEAQQLRLESDENLVRIVTVHKSKGLEYPVVFCPFLWDGRLQNSERDLVLYHDPAQPGRTVLAVGAEEQAPARRQARLEEMAENLRLCYVALTRAQQRCTLVWGKIKDADSAPVTWLLHHPPVVGPSQDVLEVTRQRFNDLEPAALRADLHRAFAAVPEAVAIAPLSRTPGVPYQAPVRVEPALRARTGVRPAPDSWRVGSFTGLTARQANEAPLLLETPDYDLGVTAPGAEAAPIPSATIGTAFAFPRGARAGICLHAIFERLDFATPERDRLEVLVTDQLQRHGLDATLWTETVVDWVQRVVTTPLNAQGLVLATLTPEQRLHELEFTYPVASLRAEALRELLAQHGYAVGPLRERIETLEFSPLHGYMKGFIDLVFEREGRFYLADYKSNWLGPDATAYRRSALAEVMARESYWLQALIYTVALHRYLGQRLPNYRYERHFGGVFYLFLRGMEPALGLDYGVFQEHPAPELVLALDVLLAGGAP